MARKNTEVFKVVDQADLSGDFTSVPTLIRNLDNISYQINALSPGRDANGTFAVEASLDYAVDALTGVVTNEGNWIPLTLSGVPTLAGASDEIIINLNQLPFIAVRLAYTAVSGGGTCDAYIACKQVGG